MTEDDKALVDRMRNLAEEWFEMCDDIHEPLTEAADRIEALIADNKGLCDTLSWSLDRIEALIAENARLRDALSWAEKVDPDLVFAIRVHAACGAAK